MTHEELQARVFAERNELDAEVQRLRLENLALSVKLEEAQALTDGILAAYRDDDSLEACNACEQCGQVFMCSFHTVLSLLAGRTKLDAEPSRKLEASPGEIVKACPQCGNQTRITCDGSGQWSCYACDVDFEEPAYYQKVKGPA